MTDPCGMLEMLDYKIPKDWPLDAPATAASDLLSTVDYLLGQLARRDGQLDAVQIAMLRESADRMRAETRAVALTDASR